MIGMSGAGRWALAREGGVEGTPVGMRARRGRDRGARQIDFKPV